MMISDLGRYALGICAVNAILAGCGSQTPIGAPGAMPQMQTSQRSALGTAPAISLWQTNSATTQRSMRQERQRCCGRYPRA